MNKALLLQKLTTDWADLTTLLEGVPHEAFDQVLVEGQSSVKEICAFLTAWDGEALRRLHFFTGQRFEPISHLDDVDYWQRWGEKQVAIKQIMSPQGVMIDMIGTRQRLLSQIAEAPDFHIERWLEADSQAIQPYFEDYLAQVKSWRAAWDKANPPATGLKKWWQMVQAKFKNAAFLV